MKMKKWMGVALSAVMVATMMASCGSSSDPTTTAAATDAEKTTAEATTAAAAGTDAATTAGTAEGGKTLIYWSIWSSTEPQAKVIQEAAAAYEAKTGNKIQIEWKGRDINKVIQTALEANTQIDLFDEDFQRVGEQYASLCMDLEEMAKAANYEETVVAALPAAIRGWAGSLKGIVYQPYTSGVFYNKALFEKAGITSEPQTWAEFLDACQKLKDAGIEPLALDDAYVEYLYGYHLARYMGEDAVKELSKNGGWAQSAEAKKATEDMLTLVEKGYLEENAPGAYPASENEMGLTENVAMCVNASWLPAEIANNTGTTLDWGMFNYPSVDGGKDPNTVANIGGQAFAIPAYSENGQEAFDFIMMLVKGEWDQKFSDDCQVLPADTTNTNYPEMLKACQNAFSTLTDVYEWNMGLNVNSDVKAGRKTTLQKLFEGEYETADEFLEAMDALYQ